MIQLRMTERADYDDNAMANWYGPKGSLHVTKPSKMDDSNTASVKVFRPAEIALADHQLNLEDKDEESARYSSEDVYFVLYDSAELDFSDTLGISFSAY